MNQTTEPLDERRGATSASSAEADLLCPGRHLAQRGKPQTEGPYAEHGRIIHAALAKRNPSTLTLEQREIYDSCVVIENKVIANLFPQLADPNVKLKEWREERFWCKVPPQMYEHSAKPDYVARLALQALIIEYKTLAGDVPESPRNLQLRDQAVLVHGTLLVNQIAVAVVQPLVTHTPELCFYELDELKRSEKEMWDRINASHDPKAVRVPGEVQCKHCLAKKDCPEYQKWAGSTVPSIQRSLLDVPVTAWTPEQKAQFLTNKDIAKGWLEETEKELKRQLKADPNCIPGFTLKAGANRETITNPQAVYEQFSELGGTADKFLACVDVKKGALKKQLNEITGSKGLALDNLIKKILDGNVEVKQNEPSIVRKETKE